VSSIAYEGILQISSALAVGLIALAWTEKGPEQLIAVLAAALPLGLLSLSLRPSVLVSSLNRLLARLGKAPISSDAVPSPPNMLVLLGVYVLTYFVNGLAFYLVVHVVAPDVSLWLAISAFNLAGCAGIALMVFPSGIGVREAVIVALLSGHSSPEAAVQAAAVTRAVSVVTDILPVSLFSLFHLLLRLAGLLHRRRIQSEEDSAGLAEIATNP
jgi:uncharacterized membrane protein YbhN (UPF0104 family)